MKANFAIEVAGNLGIMFFLIFLGYKIKVKKDSLDDIAKIVVDLGVPALIFYSFVNGFTISLLKSMYYIFAFSFAAVLVGHGLCYLMIKFFGIEENRIDFFLSGSYGNGGLLGIPIALATFGSQGALYATVYDFGQTLLLFTAGLSLITGKRRPSIKEFLRNLLKPPIVALFTGLFFGLLSIPVPRIVMSGLETISAITSPLAMIFIGALLSQMKQKLSWKNKTVIILAMTKLILLPITVFSVVTLFQLKESAAAVILLQTATPSMVGATLLYQRYGGDASFSASAVFVTTLLSILTIPFLLLLLL